MLDKMEKYTIYFLIALGTIMLGVSFAHITSRYILGRSLNWSEELLRICLVWFSLMSATIISRRSEHIGIVVFREMMPKKVQFILLRIVRFMMLLACIIVTIVGTMLVIKALGNKTPALGIPYSLSYAAIPVSFLLMTIYEIGHIINRNFMEPKTH